MDAGKRGSGFVDVLADVAHRPHSQAQRLPLQSHQVRLPLKQFVDLLTGLQRRIGSDQQLQVHEYNLAVEKEAGQQAAIQEDTVAEEKAEMR